MKTNEEMIREYIKFKGLKSRTYYQLKSILRDYSNFQQKSLYELIKEADDDEERQIRWKRRRLKQRLINYQLYISNRVSLSSAESYLTKIKGFYAFHEIEIQKLPRLNKKNIALAEPVKYSDLPDREIIRTAVELADPLMKAIILFISSSGCARIDTLKFTVGDFINGTRSYHGEDNIERAIKKLQQFEGDIIPEFNNRRTKNNKYFITFCSDEASREIMNYIQIRMDKIKKYRRKPLDLNDPLFKISPDWLTCKFRDLNNIMKLGRVGNYNRFRSHMLRKFHASNLKKAGMDKYQINVLQGKSNGAVDEVYFFEDERSLRENYIRYLPALLILTNVKEIETGSPEYLLLKKQNKELNKKLDDYEALKRDIEEIKSWYILD